MPDTNNVFSKSKRKLTIQYAFLDIPEMNYKCFSFFSFSWHTKEMIDACMRAYEIVTTKTKKMLEATCSLSFKDFGIGNGLFTTVNLRSGSPVASLKIDSYIICGYSTTLSVYEMLTKVPTLNCFVELFNSYR